MEVRDGVTVGARVRVTVGVGVTVGVRVDVRVGEGPGVMVEVRVGVGVSVGAGVGGLPVTLKRPETIHCIPTKICTSNSPGCHSVERGSHSLYP